MKLTFYVIFFLLTGLITENIIFSQVNLEWENFHYGNNVWNTGMCKDTEDNFYISGTQNHQQAFILKYNNSGQILWTKNIPEIKQFYTFSSNLIYNTNNIYITGKNISNFQITQKYSLNGDLLWSVISEQGYSLNSIAITADNNTNVIAINSMDGINSGIVLVKYDSSGNRIWSKKCHLPVIGYVTECLTDQDNNIYFTGSNYGAYDDMLIVKYNEYGDSVWSALVVSGSYDHSNSITTDKFNNLIITGQTESLISGNNGKITTVKYNYDGNLLWIRNYNLINYCDDSGIKVKSDSQGNIITCGYSRSLTGDHDIVLIKYNQNGDSLWVKRFDSGNQLEDKPIDMKIDPYDNIYVTGYSSVNTNTKRLLILKYADNGELKWAVNYNNSSTLSGMFLEYDTNNSIIVSGSNMINLNSNFSICLKYSQTIGINNINNYIPKNFKLFQNYPNPFNPVTNIRFDLPQNAQVTISVYDILGQEVYSISEYRTAGSYEFRFEGSNLASGLYFYSLKAETFSPKGAPAERDVFTETKKMVLLK